MTAGDREDTRSAIGGGEPVHVDYHEPTGTYRALFDSGNRLASEVVVAAVAAATGTDPLLLPPLSATVDPDALNALFARPATGARRFRGSLTFEYAGRRVTVNSHGTLEVGAVGDRPDPAAR